MEEKYFFLLFPSAPNPTGIAAAERSAVKMRESGRSLRQKQRAFLPYRICRLATNTFRQKAGHQ
jgi:hypothetical protein